MMKILVGTHAEVREFLLHYLEHELPLLKQLQFRLHLLLCPRCTAYLRQYRASVELAQAYLDDPPPEELVELTLRFLDERRAHVPGDPRHAGH